MNLKEYSIPEDLQHRIAILFQQGEDTDKYGNSYLKGFFLTGGDCMEIKEVKFLDMSFGIFSDNNHGWAFRDDYKIIYEYCEGDTYLTPYATKEAYEAAKKRLSEWYRDN